MQFLWVCHTWVIIDTKIDKLGQLNRLIKIRILHILLHMYVTNVIVIN